MITKFKLYEEINKDKPEVGDYVICKDSISNDEQYLNFISNNIGKIRYISNDEQELTIQYENIPNNIIKFFSVINKNSCYMMIQEIEYWSKNKEDLEIILDTKNFNL